MINVAKFILLLSLELVCSSIFAQSCLNCATSDPLNNNLVACFPFNGNSNDGTTNGNNGSASANAVLTTDRDGIASRAYIFDGTASSKISVPASASLNTATMTGFTYSCWFNPSSFSPPSNTAYRRIFNIQDANGRNYDLSYHYPTNKLDYINFNGASVNIDFLSTTTFTTYTWYHVAIVIDASNNTKLYVNGVLDASSTIPVIKPSNPIYTIGSHTTLPWNFAGKIDDIRIYNRALTNIEIGQILSISNPITVTPISDKTVCAGDSVQLTASGGTTYSWSPSIGLSNTNTANPYATPSSTQEYIVTISNGTCSSNDTVTVTVNNNCCGSCIASIPLNTGLLACYPFTGNTNDETTITGPGTNTGATLTTDRFGNINSAYSFGNNKKIEIPAANLKISNYTYSTWVYITSLPSNGSAYCVMTIGGSTVGDQALMLCNNYSGAQTGFTVTSYRQPSNPSGPDKVNTGVLPSINTWYNLVQVRDVAANKLKLYVNGTKIGETTLSNPNAIYDNVSIGVIGARDLSNFQFLNGKIDDIRIYNRALSDAEISILYNIPNQSAFNPSAGNDNSICLGDSIQLKATGGTTYLWNPSTTLTNANIANPYTKPTSTQQYIVTISNGTCNANDTVVVNVSNNCCVDCKDPFPLNTGLIGCYPFNGNANDESPNGNNGTAFANATLTTDRKGVASKAYLFNGASTSYIRIPASASLNTASMTNFSFGCWFNPSISASARRIFCIQDATNKNYDLSYNHVVNKLNYINFNGTSDNINFTSNIVFSPNTWYYITIIIAGNNTQLYVNGVLDAFSTVSVIKPSNPTYTIGNHAVNAWNFIGKIDDVRIYNRALSVADIMDLMALNKPGTLASFSVSNDTTICKGDSLQLTASAAYNYTWAPSSSLSSLTIANPIAKPSDTTMYFVTGRNGVCATTDSVKVNVRTVPADAGAVANICLGDSVQLNASGGMSYTWKTNSTLSDTTIQNPYAKPLASAKYHVRVSDGTCTNIDSVTISVTTKIGMDAGSDKTICSGDSVQLVAVGGTSYLWNSSASLSNINISNPYAKPADTSIYYITITKGPCSVIDSVKVNIKKTLVDAGTTQTICFGDSTQLQATGAIGTTYSWALGSSLNNALIADPFAKPSDTTLYKVTATFNGCSAQDSVTINVNKIPVDAGPNTSICNGDSIKLNASGGILYAWKQNSTLSDTSIYNPYAKPSSATKYFVTVNNGTCSNIDSVIISIVTAASLDAGLDTNICLGDSVRLQAVGASSYLWSANTSLSDTTIANPYAKPNDTTVYYVTGISGSCAFIDSVKVNVKKIIVDAGSGGTICNGDSIQLNATGNTISFTWGSSSSLNNTSIADPYASPYDTTVYYVTGTKAGCTLTDSVKINVRKVSADAGINLSVCLGDSMKLNANGGISFTWENDPSLSSLVIADPYAKPTINTTYYVKVSDGTCNANDSVSITLKNLNTINAGLDTSICLGDSVQLLATGAGSYTWTPNIGLNDIHTINPKASPSLTTDYIVRGLSGVCYDTDTLRVTVNLLPTVDLGIDTTICLNDEYTFYPSVTNADLYSWLPKTLLDNAAILSPTTNLSGGQTFILMATNSTTKCKATDTIIVNVNAPKAQFTLKDTISFSPPLIIEPTNTSNPLPLTYNWEMLDTIPTYYADKEPSHSFTTAGTYRILLTVIDNKGCTDTISRFVTVLNEAKIFIPNVFTPSGDGLNDVFEIVYAPGTLLSLEGQIWNRWGTKIHEFSIPQNNWWDGKFEDKDASDGVYFYTIKAVNNKSQTLRFNGTVTLLR
jgi:gliding motility-associated-like protein